MKKFLFLLVIPLSVNAENVSVTLDKCIDGESANFKVTTGEVIPARFLSVDTPDVAHPTKGEEPFAKAASYFTCNILTSADKIELEYDSDSDKTDTYGRKLVWVFADGVLIQESLVEAGYANVNYFYDNLKYTDILTSAEEKAKSSKIGIWSLDDDTSNLSSNADNESSTTDDNREKEADGIIGFFSKLFKSIKDFISNLVSSLSKIIDDFLNNEG